MVTTRGRQSSALSTSEITEKHGVSKAGDRLANGQWSFTETPKKEATEYENGTIGSRLRKRHRTGSFPTEGSSTRSKRSNLRKRTPPDSKRAISDSVRREHSLATELPTNGHHTDSTISPSPSPGPTPQPIVSDIRSDQEHHSPSEPPEFSTIPPSHHRTLPPSITNDLASVIANIIDHGEQVDSLRGYDQEWGMVDTESLRIVGASLHLKTQSLPILDNLATQILNTLAKSTYNEILTIVTEPESDSGQAYATLKSLFDHTKKVYAMQSSFLNPTDVGLLDPTHIEVIRKANLATFISSVFGSQDVGFYHLNEYFLDTFVADGQRLLKSQAQLFLDLKTQAYISAMSSGQRSRDEILNDLFPNDLEQLLLSRRPGARQLAPSEADFLQRARNRCNALLDEANTEEAIASLPDKYVWEDFLKEISSYVSKNFEMLAGMPVLLGRQPNGTPADSHSQQQQMHQRHAQMSQQQHLHQAQPRIPQNHTQFSLDDNSSTEIALDTDDIAEKAARAAHIAMQGFGVSNGQSMHPQQHMQRLAPPPPPPPQFQYHFESQPPHPSDPHLHPHQHYSHHSQHLPPPGYYQPQTNGPPGLSQQHPGFGDQNGIPFPTQTAPTQVLYERARMAATAKSSPNNRRGSTPSQRRPWSTEEENALMAGLDIVKGPHWSQILAMFGPGGTRNEILKDRNQVQLKDKARNLKLFFLKSGIEVPYYLQFVTGELKTRAPAQAAKNEERKRTGASEDGGTAEPVAAVTERTVSIAAETPIAKTEEGVVGALHEICDGVVATTTAHSSNGVSTPTVNGDHDSMTPMRAFQVEQMKQQEDVGNMKTPNSGAIPHRPHEPVDFPQMSNEEARKTVLDFGMETTDEDAALEAARSVALQLAELQALRTKMEDV